jgi:hypothetical protein
VASETWCETPLHSRSDEERLAVERVDRVLEQVHEAAEELWRAYYGKDEDGAEAEAEAAQ